MSQAHHSSVKVYLAVFGALMFLTLVTVGVSWLHLPALQAVGLALLIASVKAGLVAAFFMHLKSEVELIYGVLTVTFLFMAVLFSLPIADFVAVEDKLVFEAPAVGAPEHP